MILQLDPTIMVETPLGTGQTLFIIDYGMHQNTCWVIALKDSGIIKHFDSCGLYKSSGLDVCKIYNGI